MEQNIKFSKEFLWGASSSAYQCEGAVHEDDKELSVQDVKKVPEGTSDFLVASDHYHRYQEDIELLAEMHARAYRFSIAWTRIMKKDGTVNQKGVQHYHDVIDTCLKNNIVPIVTMYHFDLPHYLDEKGGWSNPETIDAYVEFAKVLFKEYGDKVPYFLTINEQNIMIMAGSVIGTGSNSTTLKDIYQKNHHMMLAQAKAMILCHEMAPKAKIGPAPNINSVYAASDLPEDYQARNDAAAYRNWLYLDLAVFGRYNLYMWNMLKEVDALPDIKEGDMELLKQAKPDFISLNYYMTMTVKAWDNSMTKEEQDQQRGLRFPGHFQMVSNNNLEKTPFGWEIDPLGFKTTLREVYDRYQLPIIISENGIGLYDELEADGTVHDDYRIKYYREHIAAMAEAIDQGADVFGYCPWSAMDLISTHEGIRKRYGFVYVNRTDEEIKDMNRYKKDSFFWYKKMIDNDGTY